MPPVLGARTKKGTPTESCAAPAYNVVNQSTAAGKVVRLLQISGRLSPFSRSHLFFHRVYT